LRRLFISLKNYQTAIIPVENIWPPVQQGELETTSLDLEIFDLQCSFLSSMAICLCLHSALQNAFSPLFSCRKTYHY